MFKAQEGLEDLVHELKSLRKRNDKLSAELASLRDAEEVKKSNSSRAALQEQVKDLKGQVRQLEKVRGYVLRNWTRTNLRAPDFCRQERRIKGKSRL